MHYLWLALAGIGALAPWTLFASHIGAQGPGLAPFLAAAFANPAAAGLATDLLISSVVFWCYLYVQRSRGLWAYVLVNLVVGLSCALPLYLFVRALPGTPLTNRDA